VEEIDLKNKFIRILLKKMSLSIFLVGVMALFYFYAMFFIDHKNHLIIYVIILFAVFKTITLSYNTIKQLSRIVKKCHSFNQLLWIFGLLIGLSIFSFATDYTCLFMFNNQSFIGTSFGKNYFSELFQFFYFSLTTFSTLGYGDISPASNPARFLVILEVFLSFLIIVFAVSNISKIHITENINDNK
tara:strand:+ start:198 stop:758 length:561 start_codon:yes stop_codon:yes gene_type:complete